MCFFFSYAHRRRLLEKVSVCVRLWMCMCFSGTWRKVGAWLDENWLVSCCGDRGQLVCVCQRVCVRSRACVNETRGCFWGVMRVVARSISLRWLLFSLQVLEAFFSPSLLLHSLILSLFPFPALSSFSNQFAASNLPSALHRHTRTLIVCKAFNMSLCRGDLSAHLNARVQIQHCLPLFYAEWSIHLIMTTVIWDLFELLYLHNESHTYFYETFLQTIPVCGSEVTSGPMKALGL